MQNKNLEKFQSENRNNLRTKSDLRRSLENLALAVGTLVVLFGGANYVYNKFENYAEKNWVGSSTDMSGYINSEEFRKAKWIDYENKSGKIYDCFLYEEVAHTADNWRNYRKEVGLRALTDMGVTVSHADSANFDKIEELAKKYRAFEGETGLPELDGNGKVGKVVRKDHKIYRDGKVIGEY